MHRFFVSAKDIKGNSIIIDGDDASHILRVLRLRIDDEIIVCDGEETEYICSISSIDKKSVACRILERKASIAEPSVRIHLYQGIPKSVKMDLIVQKCTEIGIYSITPVYTERVVVRRDNDRDLPGKISRWQRIAEEASKQSGRGRIPIINSPMDFSQVLICLEGRDVAVMPYEKECKTGLKQVMQGKNNINDASIFIGPEGGFTDDEVNKAKQCGIETVSLGPRILRTETAGFACLTMMLYELDEMGGR